RMSIEPGAQPLGRAKSYDWLAYSFPEPNALAFSCGIEVVGVFGFPLRDGVPFVLGLAGRDSARAAFDAAAAEALQLLAFLWGEAPPDEAPHRPGPMQHLDTYQVPGAHHAVRRWLEGAHLEFGTKRPAASAGRIGYVDLTPAWLPSHLRVAKAVCDQAMPLVFGESPHSAHLPRQLRIHPIP
ncbi:MAG TPA: hypothetical protein VM580_32720, partial [Labilithrix sp.]|nr:hypothetical protein [Labilithrix sp.]